MARYYKGKRIGANVYTQGKFGKIIRETLDTDNIFLYSDGRYPTKLTAKDLPEDYIEIHSRVIWYMKGFLKTSDITDLKYRISIFSPTRPDLQFSLHKTMLWANGRQFGYH